MHKFLDILAFVLFHAPDKVEKMDIVALATDRQRESVFIDVAGKLNLPPCVVERDFWISWSLGKIFANPELRDILRLNGGVSISKAYNIIERISPDVDLVLRQDVILESKEEINKTSKNKQRAFNRQLEERDGQFIQSVLKNTISSALADICSIARGPDDHVLEISYPGVCEYNCSLPTIKLEIGCIGLWNPYTERPITSFVSDVLPEFKDKNPIVPTITATKTFWDKVMLLHREAHRPEGANPPPARCSRHYYDIFKLAHTEIKEVAFTNIDTLKNIAEFNLRFYPRGWAKYDEAKPGSVKLIPPEYSIPKLKSDYENIRTGVYGSVPEFENILTYLAKLEFDINNLPHR